MYNRYISTNGQICQSCSGQGFTLEHRWTNYTANVRWVNKPYFEDGSIEETTDIGRIGANFLRTKTQRVSYDDILKSIGATVDGVNVELFREPRFTGFGTTLYYVVSWWRVVNR